MAKAVKSHNMEPQPKHAEILTKVERPKYGALLLDQIKHTLQPFRENPKTAKYAEGIDGTVIMLGDVFLATPRPSGNEKEIANTLAENAKTKGWYAEVDTYQNVGMVIPATPGYEDQPPTLVHGHSDIVAAPGENAQTNPEVDPIKPETIDIDGAQWVQAADDTTAGFDDGAGVATLIQAVEDTTNERDQAGNLIPHGPILVLITSREEVGLRGMEDFERESTFNPEGAFALLFPKVDHVLNSDGEQVDRVTVGSLGGEQFEGKLDVAYEPLPEGYEYIHIKVNNFRGGHSGNYAKNPTAFLALSSLLEDIALTDVRIASLTSRNKVDNALAQDADVLIAAPAERHDEVVKAIEANTKRAKEIYPDDLFSVSFDMLEKLPDTVMDDESSQKTFQLLTGLMALQGIASSSEIFGDDLLERSLNIGFLKTEGNSVNFLAMSRIRKPDQFGQYPTALDTLANQTGMTYSQSNLPIWEPNFANEKDWHQVAKIYQDMFGITPHLEFAPGGTELGIFARMLPDAVILGNGVTIVGAHKNGERMLAKSLPEVYIWNRLILARWRDEKNEETRKRELSSRRDSAEIN